MTNDLQLGGVDFHCHLDLYPDLEAAIARAEAARIYTLTVTTTPKAWPRNHELTRGTRYVRAALGLHPQLVAERAGELPLWERHLPETRYVGEVGLDAGPRFYKSLETQKRVFRTVLERCAEAGGKILTVHSIRTVPMVLDMIEHHLPRDRGAVVLHWFTGSRAEARRAAALGCYFSVNAEMTRSDRGRALVAELPMDRLLTETDGPFTQIDGRPTEPADTRIAIEAVARSRNLASDAIARAVRTNLQTLLRST
ncbi:MULTISPECIES: Qat anti-phage system TatD family nuclease QatD [Hyphomicrobiales]|jgi:TatD DNase family protein|uniref:Qat anti-phage system TatD family nuclease QatD n=1 Tax=Hyphomicrobiales TaxID=356 RepID=UPI000A4CB5F2|nr:MULTISPECIES: Qat anti-phage system TatD family nuclease QatD [Hyphomicrobiales]RAI36662.1 hydrolase TatD [Rhodoplanes serenus]RVO59164.1 TatD family deoxyribonuclease [Sinorhizobium meliloti]HET6377264.1 Qat anti-phage system TatD family nuclease QatD [Methylocella sp.]